ncbi:MAG: hypothetical protein K2M00_00285, partial [Muribaculaceae bacterium]|nr:hypothetical protein [Muribaculaceae bacterium]
MKNLSFIKILCFTLMLGAGFTLSAKDNGKTIRFQSPNSDITNISGTELFSLLTEEDIVESVETNGVTLISEAHISTAGVKWGSISLSNGFIKFNLLPYSAGFITKVSLQTIGSSTPDKVTINGVANYNWRDNNSQYVDFNVNKKAASVTIECKDGHIEFEEVVLYFDKPLKPVVYNEAGMEVDGKSTDIIVGQALKVVSTGADVINVKHNGIEKFKFDGEEIEFRPMEPGTYTFSGSNKLGQTEDYSILVTVNQPKEGQRLTLVTNESDLLPGYLYVYQVHTDDKILALGTEVKRFPNLDDNYPVALEIKGAGNVYKNGMETILLEEYLNDWSWKLTNMGKYICDNVYAVFAYGPCSLDVKFNNDQTAAIYYVVNNTTYIFCYSTKAECFTVLPDNNENYLLGRLYRVDPIAELPIVDPEDRGDDQTVTINGEKCVTRTLTVTFPATATTPASNYVLRYGDIDLAIFELINGEYVATATLPYIKGADLMIISSDSGGAGSFSLGNPWKDLESTIVEQPIDIPAVITIDVASGKASFRQALNFR